MTIYITLILKDSDIQMHDTQNCQSAEINFSSVVVNSFI